MIICYYIMWSACLRRSENIQALPRIKFRGLANLRRRYFVFSGTLLWCGPSYVRAKSDFSIFHNTPDHIVSWVFLFRRSQRVKEKSQLLFSGSSQKLGQWRPHPPWRLFQKMNKEAGNELLIKLSNSLLRPNFVLPEARIGRVSNKTLSNISLYVGRNSSKNFWVGLWVWGNTIWFLILISGKKMLE